MFLNTGIWTANYRAKYSDFNRELCSWIPVFEQRTAELNTLILTGNYILEFYFSIRKHVAPCCYFNRAVSIYVRLTRNSCVGLKRSCDAKCNSLLLFPWTQDRKKKDEFYCTKDVCAWVHFFPVCRHKGRRKSGSCIMVVLVSFMLIVSVNTRASQRRKYSWDKGIFLLYISARLCSVIIWNFYEENHTTTAAVPN
jgi:hypothetical protein